MEDYAKDAYAIMSSCAYKMNGSKKQNEIYAEICGHDTSG